VRTALKGDDLQLWLPPPCLRRCAHARRIAPDDHEALFRHGTFTSNVDDDLSGGVAACFNALLTSVRWLMSIALVERRWSDTAATAAICGKRLEQLRHLVYQRDEASPVS
jgi:hypothetical protein